MSQINKIQVFWDRNNEPQSWAYRLWANSEVCEEDGIDTLPDDLDGAIEQAINMTDLDLTPDQFAREPKMDGGYAVWSADSDSEEE